MLRMSSTGLGQSRGAADTTSLMRKSPLGSSATPPTTAVLSVLCSSKAVPTWQISVAKTLALAFVPTLLPAPSNSPRPSTVILPSALMSAVRREITHI